MARPVRSSQVSFALPPRLLSKRQRPVPRDREVRIGIRRHEVLRQRERLSVKLERAGIERVGQEGWRRARTGGTRAGRRAAGTPRAPAHAFPWSPARPGRSRSCSAACGATGRRSGVRPEGRTGESVEPLGAFGRTPSLSSACRPRRARGSQAVAVVRDRMAPRGSSPRGPGRCLRTCSDGWSARDGDPLELPVDDDEADGAAVGRPHVVPGSLRPQQRARRQRVQGA